MYTMLINTMRLDPFFAAKPRPSPLRPYVQPVSSTRLSLSPCDVHQRPAASPPVVAFCSWKRSAASGRQAPGVFDRAEPRLYLGVIVVQIVAELEEKLLQLPELVLAEALPLAPHLHAESLHEGGLHFLRADSTKRPHQ